MMTMMTMATGLELLKIRMSEDRHGSASRQAGNVKRDRKLKKQTVELEKMLLCVDWYQRREGGATFYL